MDYNSLKALYIVTNAGFADYAIEIAREVGVRGATILNSRGEGVLHKSFMGITMDSEKEMILCIVDAETAEKTMATLKEKAGIDTPAHCVCFSMNIDKATGLGTLPPVGQIAPAAAEREDAENGEQGAPKAEAKPE